MKILILTSSFTPDLNPGSFRMAALIKNLEKLENVGLQIDLITSVNNEFKIDRNSFSTYNVNNQLNIYKIFYKKSNFRASKILSFMNYANFANKVASKNEYDLVFATSSKLGTAVLGSHISRKQNCKLYLDIRDLFVENIEELYKFGFIKLIVFPLLKKIEKNTINRATKINIVSGGFDSYLKKISPKISLSLYTNGIDELFSNATFQKSKPNKQIIKILYAGNIGEGQGLEKILPEAALKLGDRVIFKVIGNGAYKERLIEEKKRLGLKNILISDPVSRNELMKEYSKSDILFLHLNNYKVFEKVIPSKIFEYGATGKPILAGVSGYPKTFISNHLPDVIFFDPTNVMQLIKRVVNFEVNENFIDRTEFLKKFNREKIMGEMAKEIISLASNKDC